MNGVNDIDLEAARRAELAAFIRAKRRSLQPADVGLPARGRRRVDGLRREEVSQLANISVTWLTQIEQARNVRPSGQVLDALARALRLSEDECHHVRQLGGQPVFPDDTGAIPAALRTLVETSDVPVVVGTWWGDYVAWNASYVALAGFDPARLPADRRNWLWANFTQVVPRDHIDDWDERDRLLVAELRYDAAGNLSHPALVAIVEAVSAVSERFRNLWSSLDVRSNPLDGTTSHYHLGDDVVRVTHLQLHSPTNPSLRVR